MGCNSSKATPSVATTHAAGNSKNQSSNYNNTGISKASRIINEHALLSSRIRADKPERLYHLLAKALSSEDRSLWYAKILEHIHQEPSASQWKNPNTGSTPLHLACRLVDVEAQIMPASTAAIPTVTGYQELVHIIDILMATYPDALRLVDAAQNIPLHYAIAPSTHFNPYGSPPPTDPHSPEQQQQQQQQQQLYQQQDWKKRAIILERLINADRTAAVQYLERNNVIYESGDATGGCTPLYRALQTLIDDSSAGAPTVEYIALIHTTYPFNSGKGNASDGDKPLSLLYRRFTRQFDISELFFTGDNSRPEVVEHRKRYRTAAGNTWKLIELLLKPTNLSSPTSPWGIVHCAVQVETPPDLLRYIVETNAQDLTRVDPEGNLPLHYAAARPPPPVVVGSSSSNHHHFPAFYTKYVMDELLYKFPEAAGMADAKGRFPLTLAVTAGKQWIGGGIKSLYDAYPAALQQLQLEDHPTLIRALSMGGAYNEEDDDDDDDGKEDSKDEHDQNSSALGDTTTTSSSAMLEARLMGVVKDEPHDAIMLVQDPNATIEEITTSMWAHEEDAGVQMLGCVAIAKMLVGQPPVEVLRIALTAVASVVNAMKAHPNEIIVQEKACKALQGLAMADGHREVSMVASGAVAAAVGAMQAHVGDTGVQEQACEAVASILQQQGGGSGGSDRATVVASVSGVTAILNALAAHTRSVGVQVAGLKALVALMRHQSNANLPQLPQAQTEPLLLLAQENFPDECGAYVMELLARLESVDDDEAPSGPAIGDEDADGGELYEM